MKDKLKEGLLKSARLKETMADECAETLAAVIERVSGALRAGGKVLLCGDGGSAADCQHIATEMVVRFKHERRALAAVALTTDTSVLTAAANDFGFEHVFERQVEALLKPGDVLLALSTSGESPNVVLAARRAGEMGGAVIAFTGPTGGELAKLADIALKIPADETYLVQEGHEAAYHLLCKALEEGVAEQP